MNGKRVFAVLLMAAAVSFLIPGCASSKKPYPGEDLMELISGEWKNVEFDRSASPARRIIDRQGNLRQYDKTYEDVGERTGVFTIVKAWTESEGWIWFRDTIRYQDTDTVLYELSKLDLRKMDWSILWSEEDFPAEWDAVEYPSYFYRK